MVVIKYIQIQLRLTKLDSLNKNIWTMMFTELQWGCKIGEPVRVV